MELQQAIDLYVDMLGAALPCAFVFAVINILVNLFLNAWCNGKLTFGGRIK